jgi:hypothetical protein
MQNPKTAELHIDCIGSMASAVLSSEKSATIFSVTSVGIFLLSPNNRMVFLSFENYRGPLTAILSGGKSLFPTLTQKGMVSISRDRILFLDSGIRIAAYKAKTWNPTLPTNKPLQHNERTILIRQLALDVYQRKSNAGMSKILPFLVGFYQGAETLDEPLIWLAEAIDRIKDQLAHRDWNALTETLISLLGMGMGLTPSGDDFIIGLLLSLNRWKSVFQPGPELSAINVNIVAAAYRKTTTLSANLIESATLGLADERLIQAVDFLVIGEGHQNNILQGILRWGNSSGVDAFAGMVTAFISLTDLACG